MMCPISAIWQQWCVRSPMQLAAVQQPIFKNMLLWKGPNTASQSPTCCGYVREGWSFRKSESSTHTVNTSNINKGVRLKSQHQRCGIWSAAALPPVLSPSSILPPPSSHCAFIPATKKFNTRVKKCHFNKHFLPFFFKKKRVSLKLRKSGNVCNGFCCPHVWGKCVLLRCRQRIRHAPFVDPTTLTSSALPC